MLHASGNATLLQRDTNKIFTWNADVLVGISL